MDIVCFCSCVIFLALNMVEISASEEYFELDLLWAKDNCPITQYLNDLIRTPPKIIMKFEVSHYEGDGGENDFEVRDLVIKKPFIFSR